MVVRVAPKQGASPDCHVRRRSTSEACTGLGFDSLAASDTVPPAEDHGLRCTRVQAGTKYSGERWGSRDDVCATGLCRRGRVRARLVVWLPECRSRAWVVG